MVVLADDLRKLHGFGPKALRFWKKRSERTATPLGK